MPPCFVAGFTLVEVLTTLTIGSLLLVSAVSATRALSTAREGVDRRLERSSEARRGMEAIVAALRNVRRDPEKNKPVVVGKSGGQGAGNDDINLMVIGDRRVRSDTAESDQYEVEFYLSSATGVDLPKLICRRDHGLDDHPDDGGIATVIAEGIVGLSFEYSTGSEWFTEWKASEPQTPKAVRVTIEAAAKPAKGSRRVPETVVLSTVVPIRVNAADKTTGKEQPNVGEPPR